MIIKNAQFITSVANKKDFIVPDRPMIAVCGKSNVGKSSFINMLANQKKLARTSSQPGRTRLVNYFDFGEFILADLPGYGYASVAKSEKEKWSKLMESFFAKREFITHTFALVDIRHKPTNDDLTMIEYLFCNNMPFTIIATKADKVAKTKVKEYLRVLSTHLTVGIDNIIATSSNTRQGKDDVLNKLDQIVLVYNENDSTLE